MATELKQLIFKRGQIKSRLTRLKRLVDAFDENVPVAVLRTHLRKNDTLLEEFRQVHEQIEFLDQETDHSEECVLFENTYFHAISNIEQLIEDKANIVSRPASVASVGANTSQNISNIKLPTIKLPEFDGNYSNWLQFYDTFNTLINDNDTISNVQKFFYLKSSLKGEAAQVLHSLEASEQNYPIAWELLKSRFENKRIIVYTHLKALFDLPSISKESSQQLRKLTDDLFKHLRALKMLGRPVNYWDDVIIYLICLKLDFNSKREWESSIIGTELPSFESFSKFLSNRCQLLESIKPSTSLQHKPVGAWNNNKISNPPERSASFMAGNSKCLVCKQDHSLHECKTLLGLSPADRLLQVKNLKLCTNCLKGSHSNHMCKARGCAKCGKRHNTILHFENANNNESQPNASNTNQNSDETLTMNVHNINNTNTLLCTAVVHIFDKQNNPIKCRALLDSGSQSNFITANLAKRLGLKTQKINLPVTGINQFSTTITCQISATMQSLYYDTYKKKLPFLVINKIADTIPNNCIDISNINIPNEIILADPEFNRPSQIDILLGVSIFWDLLCIGQFKSNINGPIFQKTKLGWIVSGPINFNLYNNNLKQTNCNFVSNQSIQDQLERFWKLEECPVNNKYSADEMICEENFMQTTKRDNNGRFIVTFPIRENAPALGDSLANAIKRFSSLERRLSRNTHLKNEYSDFMAEYEALGHMTKIKNVDLLERQENQPFYLPHHCVVKESSLTTKLRVVFDGSCATSSGVSLNDILLTGPTIQDNLFSILIRFRKHCFVVTADIEKMYRQVQIAEHQRDLQRIIWRTSPDQPISHFKLNTVTYGTAPASFLAIRCLHQLALENNHKFPDACDAIQRDFYVDDLITGSDTISGIKQLKSDISSILQGAGFNLRKWMSNCNDKIFDCPGDSNSDYFITDSNISKTLGIYWRANTDILQYSITLKRSNDKVSKREILSAIAQIFDPLGLISPCVINVKIMLQKLWLLKLNWDESVPLEIYTQWIQFLEHISDINNIQIPRHAMLPNPVDVQLHGFCDSSESAYGACLYLRTTDVYDNIYTQLLCAKSRVAPLKTVTLPRLELCGALLLSELTDKTLEALRMNVNNVYLWCDSTIVLSWLAAQSNNWKTFVANRVSQIQKLTSGMQWRHVRSPDNPADILSRGINPRKLAECYLWWRGPQWLSAHSKYWPNNIITIEELPERKCMLSSFCTINATNEIFDKFSCLQKLQRVVAYCLRFFNNVSNKSNKFTGYLTTDELNNSMRVLVKLLQSTEFSSDIRSLKLTNSVKPNSKLKCLNPFLDEHGILRVGGRLKNANINFNKRYPIVLPSKHNFTKLVIEYEHKKHLHAGAQGTLAAVRRQFWPINGRNSVRGVLSKCITCFKSKPIGNNNLMGNLPAARVTPSRPFFNCGIDYAGPFLIRDGKLKNRKLVKSYLCLFVCFATKAVHFELAVDLSSESFLNCLKRFTSRRGYSKNIYSDNGTNFVGADNELKRQLKLLLNMDLQSDVQSFFNKNVINFHYTPPRSPHFGGLWESVVKSAKTHLKRIVGNAHLTFEELYTVLTQIEAVLNSRPLTPLSNDPNDLQALTPGHFLIGDVITAAPESDIQDTNINRLSRYQKLQYMVQHFWTRWSKEYLHTLQQREKWRTQKGNQIQPGTMVLLKEQNLPPLYWKLGRITEVHPGSDGVVRVVNIKTENGVTKRGITEICILPFEGNT